MTGTNCVRAEIGRLLDANATDFVERSRRIWSNPEIAFEEHQAAELLTRPLADAGFEIERGLAGLGTSFRATWRRATGGPTVAILCEYDALRGVGHACGHNLIGVGGVAAGWALRHAWPDLPGTLQIIGAPAEEDGGGKIIMVRDGVFDEVDAAMMFHPTSCVSKPYRGGLACQEFKVRFFGKPAHASSAPWSGVNALDAMIQFYVGIGLLRQQLSEDVRLHGVITHGGAAPNVIPEYTETEFLARADKTPDLARVMRQVRSVAEGAALATGCTFKLDETMLYENRINNMTLARLFEQELTALGETVADPSPLEGVGSSDIGNVSRVCPTIHPYISISEEPLTTHSTEFRDAAGSDHGLSQMLKAAKALAATAAALFEKPALLATAKAELVAALAAESS